MTDTEELERLAASITPGPWNSSIHGTQVLTGDSWNTICEIRVRKDFSAAQWEDGRGSSDPTANAQAIALVPDLLAEVIALRAEVERFQARATAAEADAAALGNVLWMADEWFEHGGSETMMPDEYRDDLMKASEALAAHTQRVNAKEGV